MLNEIRKNAAYSVVQTISSGVCLFILYRYLAINLGTAELGLWSIIIASASIGRLSDLGLSGSVIKFVSRSRVKNDHAMSAEIVETALISVVGGAIIVVSLGYPVVMLLVSNSVPKEMILKAKTIMPWAASSLIIGIAINIVQSALDGYQRMNLRNVMMVIGNLLYLVVGIAGTKKFGLLGIAISQVIVGILNLISTWYFLRRSISYLSILPRKWRLITFKELFKFSLHFQVSAIALMIFDPATKLLMGRYGGLDNAALYEMASQFVLKARAILVSACQSLSPKAAELTETSLEGLDQLFCETYRLFYFLIIPFYVLLAMLFPIVSILFLGKANSQFILYGQILSFAWCINNLNTVGYFINIGSGIVRWNTVSFILTSLLNIFLGFVIGPVMGGMGVIISAVIALVTGSAIILITSHKQYGSKISLIIPSDLRCYTFIIFIIGAGSWIGRNYLSAYLPRLYVEICVLFPVILMCGLVMKRTFKQELFLKATR